MEKIAEPENVSVSLRGIKDLGIIVDRLVKQLLICDGIYY
jgi:hypothetical protein